MKIAESMRGALAPMFVVYILIFGVILAFFRLAQMEDVSFWVDLVKAAPFGFSALIIGTFSVLFWALNYLSRSHRSNLRVREVRGLFRVRVDAIQLSIEEHKDALSDRELLLLKTHLLFSGQELPASPETPTDGFSLNYSEVVSSILKRS